MKNRTMIEASKILFEVETNEATKWEEIKMGCLQRIASALEGINGQLTYMNNRERYLAKRNESLETRNRNLRAKLAEKKKVAHVQD
jgi:hypothetical protein